ncbi:MAG TPA: hypothetical protein VGP72_11990 [Planctomycetota bacterium]
MATANVPTKQPVSETALLQAEFPEQRSLVRRIHKLWPGAYRVNFHRDDGSHTITESWFVTVENGCLCRQVG